MSQTGFSSIAPYLNNPLNNPLVLVGFALMLVFGVQKQLLRAGVLPQLKQREAGIVVRLVLRYGFWLGVLVVILGIGLQYLRTAPAP